ncbi:MAG: DsbA family protein [Bdellovibrionaceae bacterium]|jgi:protein-disulfide isomerase|nr:DsbA family protein [Pseudobdellovibrionaceae bacterium]
MITNLKRIMLLLLPLAFVGCNSPAQLKKTLEENPDIVFNMIEKHPEAFLKTLNKAAKVAQEAERKNAAKKEQEDFEKEFSNPKKPVVENNRIFFSGTSSSPVTIVEYSDFQCYYCSKAHTTVQQIKEKYGDKVRILYKHFPMGKFPHSKKAALYFEAIGKQDGKKAEKFHDLLFSSQADLRTGGEAFLKKSAKKVGANLTKVLKAINSPDVKARVEGDIAEAQKFNFNGTPGFLVNGVTVKGAYPFDHFEKIIERHLKK